MSIKTAEQVLNATLDLEGNSLNIEQELPTAYRAVTGVTSATPDEATEYAFGLPDGVLSKSVTVRNRGSSPISISYDGGITYDDPIAVGSSIEDIAIACESIFAKSAGVSQDFTILVGGDF